MIYLDNAATTLKKPESVYKTFMSTWRMWGANAGRGGHRLALAASERVYDTAEKAAELFNIENPENIAFTYNTTMALNMAIKGVLKPGEHVVLTSLEHNSVYRPVAKMQNPYTVVYGDEKGYIRPEMVEKAINKGTKLIIANHASNVCKSICDIEAIGKIAKMHNCLFLVDSAQSGGVLNIDVRKMNIDMLAFAGHKALYGPQGTGGLYVGENILPDTIIEGGSGGESLNERQPENMPEHLTAGTVNMPGIAALGAGIDFVLCEGVDSIYRHENMLLKRFEEKIRNIDNVIVYTPDLAGCGVISINIKNADPVSVGAILDKEYNIAVRCGFHCSPLCHKMLKTIDTGGTVRFSFSYFNTKKEADAAAWAVYKIAKQFEK